MELNAIKEALLAFYTETGVRPQDAAIGSGAALVYHKLRESTSDIDISVPRKIFSRLCYLKGLPEDSTKLMWNDQIELHIWTDDITASIPTIWGCFYDYAEILMQKTQLIARKERSQLKIVQDFIDIENLNSRIKGAFRNERFY